MSDLFAWTNLFPHRTGLPATIWVSVHGQIASDPDGAEHGGHREAVFAWIELNRDVLAEHWRGEIDGAEMAARSEAAAVGPCPGSAWAGNWPTRHMTAGRHDG